MPAKTSVLGRTVAHDGLARRVVGPLEDHERHRAARLKTLGAVHLTARVYAWD